MMAKRKTPQTNDGAPPPAAAEPVASKRRAYNPSDLDGRDSLGGMLKRIQATITRFDTSRQTKYLVNECSQLEASITRLCPSDEIKELLWNALRVGAIGAEFGFRELVEGGKIKAEGERLRDEAKAAQKRGREERWRRKARDMIKDDPRIRSCPAAKRIAEEEKRTKVPDHRGWRIVQAAIADIFQK